jgi:carbon storage regulator
MDGPVLVLTRRVGETVMIGAEVTVTVLRAKGNQVRLRVNAPKKISVQREETFHRIKQESVEGTERHTGTDR